MLGLAILYCKKGQIGVAKVTSPQCDVATLRKQ